MNKIDFKRDLKHLYQPSNQFTLVDVPPLQFLMIDGHGDPNTTPVYQVAVETLYAVSYKLKFMCKQQLGQDYAVLPLEGLWWADDMDTYAGQHRDKSRWDWTMIIMQPDWITPAMFAEATAVVRKQKALPALDQLRLENYHEGLSVQIMHTGSYDDEAPTLHKLHHEFMPAQGLEFNGRHHEIYLSDPRRVTPDKLKTVLRQPVQPQTPRHEANGF